MRESPTSASNEKFCMFRAPTCRTSATAATGATCRGSITSVTIGSPVAARASARISRAGAPIPWNAYGDYAACRRPHEAPGPRVVHHAGDVEQHRGLRPSMALYDHTQRGTPNGARFCAVVPANGDDGGSVSVGRVVTRSQLVRAQHGCDGFHAREGEAGTPASAASSPMRNPRQ